jgi:hypothetical protein
MKDAKRRPRVSALVKKRKGRAEMKRVFAPGCALMLYKPELAQGLHHLIEKNLGDID